MNAVDPKHLMHETGHESLSFHPKKPVLAVAGTAFPTCK